MNKDQRVISISLFRSRDPGYASSTYFPGDICHKCQHASGYYFHPRCRYAKDICSQELPLLREVQPEHYAAYHFAGELKLRGIATGG